MNHVVNVSRNANNGTNAGTFNVNANNDSSNRNRNIGTRLAANRTRLRRSIAVKFRRACNNLAVKIARLDPTRTLSAIMSYKGWARVCNAKMLWRKNLKAVFYRAFPEQLRGSI